MNVKTQSSIFMRALALPSILLLIILAFPQVVRPQSAYLDRLKDYGRSMIEKIQADIKKNYYDPTYHGIDLEARFQSAKERIKTAPSAAKIYSIIAQTLVDFNDSHLFFLPSATPIHIKHGWEMQMIGDTCYVTSVKPGSGAEQKGLKAGDVIWSINGFEPTRENLWKIEYYYFTLDPQLGMRLVIRRPDGSLPQIDIMAKIEIDRDFFQIDLNDDDLNRISDAEHAARLHAHRLKIVSDDLIVWKMPEFDLSNGEVDDKMDKVKKYKSLILDLRKNGGGAESTLLRLLGCFFDHDVKIGVLKRRKEVMPLIAKTRGAGAFQGKLVVLIDSESGSAAELFARVIQLEKRGVVIGDRSSGSVMRSKLYKHEVAVSYNPPGELMSEYKFGANFAVSITDADIIMTDGKSLEHVGIMPDELLLPTSADLAANRDPVLSRAAEIVGIKIESDKAGTLFPIVWQK